MKNSIQSLCFSTISFFAFLVLQLLVSCKTDNYDIIIKNGTVFDGLGNDSIVTDIGIRQDRIAHIGDLSGAESKLSIEAQDLVVAPGFIDLHTHLDPIFDLPGAENHVRQGVTTALGGPDGGGLWPFDELLDSLDRMELGYNIGYLIGHNKIRSAVMGLENRDPTNDELKLMKSYVKGAMENGAFGLSTGLKYLPGTFSKVGEVIELAKVAASGSGIYTSHLREEGLELIDGVKEAIQIGAMANIPVVLTHHKVVGQPMWGKSQETLNLVDSARQAGVDVMIDQYPYHASYTSISILIPGWAMAGGQSAFENRMSNKKTREQIFKETLFNVINDRGGNDLNRVRLAEVLWQPELEGKTLYDWAMLEGLDTSVETGAELVLQAQLNGGAKAIFYAMNDIDVDRIMQHPQTMIASDGRLVAFGDAHPHPRWYGTFPRVLGHYVRERKLLTLKDAILKMTSMPAKRLTIKERGSLVVGNYADITLFNPNTVTDNATFERPHQYPTGIDYVIVNGELVVEQGQYLNKKPGRVLRSQSYTGQ